MNNRTIKDINFQESPRVEKTREQHEHARGTPKDLHRNTQAKKQRISTPFIAAGKKGLTIDTTNEYDRNQAN